MAVILRTGGTKEELNPPPEKKKLMLEQLQQAVGGYIEIVSCANDKKHLLIVDEEGKLKENHRFNLEATKLFNGFSTDAEAMAVAHDPWLTIIGDAVYAGIEEID